MTRRLRWRVAGPVAALAVAAVLIPGTPAYLPNWLGPRAEYDGRPARGWMKNLTSPDPEARHQAAHALGAIGPEAEEAVPALAAVLHDDPDRQVRSEAALALFKMAPASRAAVPALGDALADENPVVRVNAALALLRMREEARPAVPALTRAVKDGRNVEYIGSFTVTTQEVAILALGRATAGTADAVPTLTEALEEARTDLTRRAAVRALGEVGPPARPAVPQLQALLRGQSDDLRLVAEDALRKIGADPAPAAPPDRPEESMLPEPERKYIWDIEHHGNLLVKYGFAPLADALRRADAQALSAVLADDFAGTDLAEPRRVRADVGFAEVERLQDSGRPPAPLSRAGFVARLLEFRKVFATVPPQVKFALMTLGPKRRGDLGGPWEGTAQLRMHGEYAKGAPAEVVLTVRYELARPPTPESLAGPGWLKAAGVTQALTARATHYLFTEAAKARGLDPSRLYDSWAGGQFRNAPGGVYVCDFDRDGILDLLVTDVTGCALYRGRPEGGFEDVTARCGLPRGPTPWPIAAWVDVDGDGWEDLILAGRFYRNEAGARFADYTDRCNLRLPVDATGVVVADYDRDGRLDLYVTRQARPGGRAWLDGRSSDPKGNYLFRNLGDWRFEDVTKAAGAAGGHRSTFSAAWLDANNDGWPDLHVVNEFGDGVLLVNNGNGTFSERPLADRPADFGTMGVAVGDVDNDGNIDIYCANMYSKAGARVIGNLAPDAYPPAVMEKMRRFVAGSQLHLNKGGLKFEQVGPKMQVAAVGWAYGPCLADFDGDGFLDLYATAGFASRNRDEPDG